MLKYNTKCKSKSVQIHSGIMPMNRPARWQAGMLSPIECTKIGLLYFFNRYKLESNTLQNKKAPDFSGAFHLKPITNLTIEI
jgi:hypothetical protein